MNAVLSAISATLRDLRLPGLAKTFALCILLNLLVLALMFAGANYLIYTTQIFDASRLEWLGDAAGTLVTLILAWLLFPVVLTFLMGFFDESLAAKVEKRGYPSLSAPPERPFYAGLGHDMKFGLRAVLLNVLALPLYFIPVVQLFIYLGLNGYLLGNQFFEMAAGRHIGKPAARELRAKHRWPVFLAGVFITLMSAAPFLNLLSPFWGSAVMVHLYHRLREAS
ncbi:MAG: EI24 domain-containing protein [Alphaproteobacteria bacterium]|nr:EI24 domain-containing protein [Alphaproteobacteria bacterium]